MHQEIFNLGFSTESISAYLLCCGLADAGKPLTIDNLSEIWTGTDTLLEKSIRDLQQRRILRAVDTDQDTADATVYQLTDVHEWVRG